VDLVEDVVALGSGREVSILRPRDAEALLDEEAFDDEERLPYWAELWPSARLLARAMADRAWRGRRVLELGCGLGLPSIAAALAGARATASDWSASAVEAALANAERNGARVEGVVCAWQEPAALLAGAPWDLVIAADVLYERRNVDVLLGLLPRLGRDAWLADPHRAAAHAFLEEADARGWRREPVARQADPPVTVHRLRPAGGPRGGTSRVRPC
jgi:predicted nicotinamide N-methyase